MVSLPEEYSVKIYPNILNDQIIKFCNKAHNELIDNNFTDDNILINDDLKAIIAHYKDQIVGIILFYPYGIESVWINLMYVHPDFRQKNIFKIMIEKLEDYCRENNKNKIYESTHCKNLIALKALDNCGFERLYITCKKIVK